MGLLGNDDFDPDRAQELAELAESDPQSAAESIDELEAMLSANREDVRNAAAYTLSVIAGSDPKVVSEIADSIREHLDDPASDVRVNITWCLAKVAEEYTKEVYPALSQLKTRIQDSDTEDAAMTAFVPLSDDYPSECTSIAEDAIRLLGHKEPNVRSSAAYVTWNIGKESPEKIRRAVTPCLDLLTNQNDFVRHNAVGTLGQIATEHPEDIVDETTQIAPLLEDSKQSVRSYAAWTMSNIAMNHPQKVADTASDRLISLLFEQGIDLRRHASFAVIGCAIQAPSTVSPTDNAISGLKEIRDAEVIDIDVDLIDQSISSLESSSSIEKSTDISTHQTDIESTTPSDSVGDQSTNMSRSDSEESPSNTPTDMESSVDTNQNHSSSSGDPDAPSPIENPDSVTSDNNTNIFDTQKINSVDQVADTQYCPYCGGEIPVDGGPFCGHCGDKLPE